MSILIGQRNGFTSQTKRVVCKFTAHSNVDNHIEDIHFERHIVTFFLKKKPFLLSN